MHYIKVSVQLLHVQNRNRVQTCNMGKLNNTLPAYSCHLDLLRMYNPTPLFADPDPVILAMQNGQMVLQDIRFALSPRVAGVQSLIFPRNGQFHGSFIPGAMVSTDSTASDGGSPALSCRRRSLDR